MRVACIGNMNNNNFSLARYLRDRRIDAHLLLLDNELPHFHPSSDTFDLGYQEYTTQLDWGNKKHFESVSAERIRQSLAPYDFLIACGSALAHIHKAGRAVDMLIPYGADLYALPFPKGGALRRIVNRDASFRRSQTKAIQEASFVNGLPYLRPALERLGVIHKSRYLGVPMVYNGIYHPDAIRKWYDRSAWFHEFKRVRDAFDLVVFHHSRHIWKTFVDLESRKGNDQLVRGFATLLERQRDLKACLVLFEYGVDVVATRRLVAELGIEDHVAWFPAMHRSEIMTGLSLADLSSGQFAYPNFGGGTIYEALALGKPIVHNRDDDSSRRAGITELPPILNAAGANEIADVLSKFCSDPKAFEEIGKRGLRWHDEYVAKTGIDHFVELIEAKASGRDASDVIESWPGRPTKSET